MGKGSVIDLLCNLCPSQDFAFTPMASSISQELFPRGRVENVPEYYDHMAVGLLSIIRNLSLIVANEEALAYHPRLLYHIVSLLPCWKTEVRRIPLWGTIDP